jgi:hypothetical protein
MEKCLGSKVCFVRSHSIEDSCNLEGAPSKILMCVFPISYEIKIDKNNQI